MPHDEYRIPKGEDHTKINFRSTTCRFTELGKEGSRFGSLFLHLPIVAFPAELILEAYRADHIIATLASLLILIRDITVTAIALAKLF